MLARLVDKALDAARLPSVKVQPDEVRVVGDYTHLVVAHDDFVIKFWRHEPKQRVDMFSHRLAEGILPVPPVVAHGRIPSPATMRLTSRFSANIGEPLPFTIYKALPGARPAAQTVPYQEKEQRAAAYKQAGHWLRQLHSVRHFEQCGPLQRFGSGWEGTKTDWCAFLLQEVVRWHRRLGRHDWPRPERRLRRIVYEWLVAELPRVGQADSFVLCHRDYSLRNLLSRPNGRLVAVIDFEHAIAGDAVFDWHRIAAELLCFNPDLDCWQAFLTGYGMECPLAPALTARLHAYLAVYALSVLDYAVREGDEQYRRQGLQLLEWVAQRIVAVS